MVCAGAAGRRGPLPWVSRGSSGLVCRRKDDAVASGRSAVSQRTVNTGLAARRRRSGYGKLSTGKFWPQQCQQNCHGSRFRVLQDLNQTTIEVELLQGTLLLLNVVPGRSTSTGRCH